MEIPTEVLSHLVSATNEVFETMMFKQLETTAPIAGDAHQPESNVTLFTSQPVLRAEYLDKPFTRKGLLEAVSLLLYGKTQPMALRSPFFIQPELRR